MDKIQKDIILEQREYLQTNMEGPIKDEEFLSDLELKGILTTATRDELKHSETYAKKFALLMDTLPTRGPKAFDEFCVCLACYKHINIAARLKAREVQEKTAGMSPSDIEVTVQRIFNYNFLSQCAQQEEAERQNVMKKQELDRHTIAYTLQIVLRQEGGAQADSVSEIQELLRNVTQSILITQGKCLNCSNSETALTFLEKAVLDLKSRTEESGDPVKFIHSVPELKNINQTKVATICAAFEDILHMMKSRYTTKLDNSPENISRSVVSRVEDQTHNVVSPRQRDPKNLKPVEPQHWDNTPKLDPEDVDKKQQPVEQPWFSTPKRSEEDVGEEAAVFLPVGKKKTTTTKNTRQKKLIEKLTSYEKEKLLGKEPLDVAMVNKCISLARNSIPSAKNMYSCTESTFQGKHVSEIVQILKVHNLENIDRYVVISNIGCPKSTVNVYDSSSTKIRLSAQSVTRVLRLCRPESTSLKLEFPRCPLQRHEYDSSIHAVANAVSLFCGSDPLNIAAYKSVATLKSHIVTCFDSGNFDLFPNTPGRPKTPLVHQPQIVEIKVNGQMPKRDNDDYYHCESCNKKFQPNCPAVDFFIVKMADGNEIANCLQFNE